MRNLFSWFTIGFYSIVAQVNTFILCGLACGYALGVYIYLRMLRYALAPGEGLDERTTGMLVEHYELAWESALAQNWQEAAREMPIIGWYFLFGFIVGGTAFVIVINIATAWQLFKLSAGAKKLVDDLGAKPMDPMTATESLKHLPEIVSELSHDFNVRCPDMFILAEEDGMNAFVVGLKRNESILVVTRGLRHLNKKQLRGILAHEIAHLANGDMRHNMRLLALQLGINSVRHTAEWMLRTGWNLLFGGASNHRAAMAAINWGCLLLIFGMMIWPMGMISSIAGAMVMAWSNRRQEFRADKLAAKILGSWEPIGDALKRIMGHNRRGRILGPECRKYGHLMFSQATGSSGGLLCTHPKMSKRIRRADKKWDGIPLFESDAVPRVDAAELIDLERVGQALAEFPAASVEIFRDPGALQVTIPSLMLWDASHRQQSRANLDEKLHQPVEMLSQCLENASDGERFALHELTLHTSLSGDPKTFAPTLQAIQESLPVDAWFQRLWGQVFLNCSTPQPPVKVSMKDFRACKDELATVVSVGVGLGASGNMGSTMSELRFQRVWMLTGLEMRSCVALEDVDFDDFVRSVERMALLPTRLREGMIKGLIEVFGENDRLPISQAALIRYLSVAWSVRPKLSAMAMVCRDISEPQLRLRS